jgi:hypothetical protein
VSGIVALAQALNSGIRSDATLPGAIAFTYGGAERKSTRINMVLLHALDLADHFSQIANYMRLNGMLPPTALPKPGRGGN